MDAEESRRRGISVYPRVANDSQVKLLLQVVKTKHLFVVRVQMILGGIIVCKTSGGIWEVHWPREKEALSKEIRNQVDFYAVSSLQIVDDADDSL